MQSTVINEKIKVVQEDDQIFRYIAINKCSLDLETVKKMTEIGDQWNQENLCGNLIDIRDLYFVDAKTRDYAASQYRPHVAGTALLVDSKISSYFANIYLRFGKHKTPIRLFTNETEALKWLHEKMRTHVIKK